MPDNKIPKVSDGCKEKGHRCMTCYEQKKYYDNKGVPRRLWEQIVRMMKTKEFTAQELSFILGYSEMAIQKTLDIMLKSGLITTEEEEVQGEVKQ